LINAFISHYNIILRNIVLYGMVNNILYCVKSYCIALDYIIWYYLTLNSMANHVTSF